MPREGESEGSALPMGTESDSLKRKWNEEEVSIDLDAPRKTRGIRPDYHYLNDPFPDENENIHFTSAEIFAIYTMVHGGDEPKSLNEAKKSPEWPEWEHAVQKELDQLLDMGTWILVQRPADAVPISNKWVFVKKYNKRGDLLKYKGRLVAKGCAQRPGYDYLETFSPVVRLESIRAILAIASIKQLDIQQMDVKGAYLNGTLNEKVYMHQPEGYDDGSGRVCLLRKTLYGLKQSGREWNTEFDMKMKKFGFRRSRADPCLYI
jgi:hypothetical protein